MLSSRLPKDLSPSPFFAELERAKSDVQKDASAGGLPLIDMTVSSPVRAGLPVDMDVAVEEARKDFGWCHKSALSLIADYPEARKKSSKCFSGTNISLQKTCHCKRKFWGNVCGIVVCIVWRVLNKKLVQFHKAAVNFIINCFDYAALVICELERKLLVKLQLEW